MWPSHPPTLGSDTGQVLMNECNECRGGGATVDELPRGLGERPDAQL